MKKLRIFISSPGDVRQERMIAKKVISDLDRVYQDYVRLEAILWEDLPLEATGSFQAGIDYFLNQAPIDIAVFILWSRLGSTLGSSFRKPDGTIYASGTEYEFDMMYTLWEKTRCPRIMVYVKETEPQYGKGLTSSDLRELLDQKDKLSRFIEEKFQDRETGTNYAYWQFDKQHNFEERLRTHLTRLIRDQIGSDIHVREWDGNPYVGLKSYEMSESPIFCGRKSLVYDIVEQLLSENEREKKPTLFVLGESGSGKSSLIKAGVLPQLMSEATEKTSFITEVLTPSSFRGHIYDGLVSLILHLYPSLKGNPVASDLQKGIPDDYDFKYLQHALSKNDSSQIPLIFIDQFEEMFSDNMITEDERKRCLLLLRGLCETQQIFMIFSMRNDFYSRFTSYPDLGLIKNLSIVIDIPNVSVSDIAEIVEEPARKANLRWERNEIGISLSRKIIEDATRLQNLPLIEFALSELYQACADTEEMTFEAYKRIGYLKGAVIQYANKFFSSLSSKEQDVFRGLLPAVITTSNDNETLFVRKTSVRKSLEKSPVHKTVIQKLIDSHLFVAGKDANGDSTVSFVHEILLSSWDIVKEWCQQHQDFLQKNNHYEKLARYWKSNGCPKKDLIQERSALLEAEYFMFHHENDLQPVTFEFIDKSLVRQRRKGLAKHIFYFVSALLLSSGLIFIILNKENIDADFKEFIEYDSYSWYDILSISVPVLLVSAHSLFLRINGRYKYKTILSSTVLWLIVVTGVMLSSLYDYSSDKFEDWQYGLLWITPFLLGGISVFFEYHRRKLWKKNIYKPYLIADHFETTKNIVLWSFIGLCGIFSLALYTVVIYEKNTRNEKTLKIADELFNGLNNISNQLSWSDKLYINEKRKNYLEEYFSEELHDTIPDKRGEQYATCLYNLHEPYEALTYLYPDSYWDDHCLYILASMKAGLFGKANAALEMYVKGKRLNDLSWITPTQLIWTAEKLGRFDLADSLYSTMEEQAIEWGRNTADIINYGHILLMKGNISDAIHYYEKAELTETSLNPQMKETEIRNIIRQNVTNDLSTFKWLEIGSPAFIDEAAQKLGIGMRNFYTSVTDSMTAAFVHQQLAGTWALADSSIVISIHPKVPVCQYRLFSSPGGDNEIYRTLTNCRFSKLDGHLYWEELNQDVMTISSGEIISQSETEFSVKIIENGNVQDRGIVRTYYRINE